MAQMYRQIAKELESGLAQMRLDGRMRLPTEEELCRMYSCSRQTVRSALDLMVGKGLIVKKRGSGSYISDKVAMVSRSVFLIVEDEDEYTNPELILKLRSALRKSGLELRCLTTSGSFEKEREALSLALSSSPAAVIIEPISNILPNHNLPLIGSISAQGIPVIYLNTSYPSPSDAMCIREDNIDGAKKLVTYLKDKRHTNIACIFRCDDSRGLERYKGYIAALYENGLPFDEKRVNFFTGNDRRRILAGNDEFLCRVVAEMPPEVTAVICQNDEIAYRLQMVLGKVRSAGRRALEVVSFDNSYYASTVSRITSLGHKNRDLVTAITDAVCRRRYMPEPIKWQLHVRS